MAKTTEASPSKSAAQELLTLRKSFRQCVDSYAERIENQLTQIRTKILEQATKPKESSSHLRELRDITTLCRTLTIRPEKGRRKDLKKIDLLVAELDLMVQKW